MTIPRPPADEQQPIDFRRHDWSSNVELRKTFFGSPLEYGNFLKILFQHVDTKSSLGVLVPWTWLLRPPHINSDHGDDVDHEWRPVRILGSGAFGVVSLWRKEEGSDITDEVAIKEAVRPEGDEIDEAGPVRNPLIGLPKEAVINADLNSHSDSENIGFLRNFRFYHEPQPKDKDKGTYRFYFNFCPYDSLDTLARRYRMWDKWLPELFIWHVLIQLIHGVKTLEKAPRSHTRVELPDNYSKCFTLHLDLKPQNILLDYPSGEGPVPATWDIDFETPGYPDIKISDFGISAYTSPDDAENPHNLDGGTDGYKPPEQTHKHDKWGESFDQPPIDDDDDKWTEAHNVWCVGKIVFDLMTLETQGRLDQLKLHTNNEQYIQRGQHFLQDDWGNKDFWESQSQEQHISQLILEAEHDALLKQKANKLGALKGVQVTSGQAAVFGNDTIGSLSASTILMNSRSKGVTSNDIDKIKQDVIQDRRARAVKVDEKRREEDDSAREAEKRSASWRNRQYQAMGDHWTYSPELRDLVRRMLDPVAKDRVKSDDILQEARAGYRATVETYQGKAKRYKEPQRQLMAGSLSAFQRLAQVHFRKTDINAMDVGKGKYQPDAEEYQRLLKKCDSDWEPLKPPRKKWESFIQPLDPQRPEVHVYEASREVPGKDVKIRLRAAAGTKDEDTTEANGYTQRRSTAGRLLPTADDYRALRHDDLGKEVAKRIRAPDAAQEALRLSNQHSVDALVSWLMQLDQAGMRGNDPRDKADENGASQASSSGSSKRRSEDIDYDEANSTKPSKKRAKGKEKTSESVSERDEQEDMYGDGARPNLRSKLVFEEVDASTDESLSDAQKQPKAKAQKQKAIPGGKKPVGVVGHVDGSVPKPAPARRGRSAAEKGPKTKKGVDDTLAVASAVQGDGLAETPQEAAEVQPVRRGGRAAKQIAKAAILQTARAGQRRGAQQHVVAQDDDEQQNPLQEDDDEVSKGEQHMRKRKGPPPTKPKTEVKAKPALRVSAEAVGKGQKKAQAAGNKAKAVKQGKRRTKK